MSTFLQQEAGRIARLEEQAAAILATFARRDYARIDPPILQPADIFLDRSGEEIRRRTFLLNDAEGRELCLRPELTIPVCRMHLENGGKTPARISCHGPAFRMRSGGATSAPTQFLQTGIEYLGAEDRAAADAEVLTLAIEALRAAGLQTFTVQIGDASLFAGLIDALDIPQAWRARLKRHFRRPQSFANLLQRLGSGDAAPGAAWLSQLGRLSEEEARNSLAGLLELLGGASREVIAGRTREEIIDRLMEQAADASSRHLPKNALAVIEAALAISGSAEKSVAALGAVLKQHGVALDAQLGALNTRIAVLAKLGFAGEQVNFAPRFGRNLDYYTGFVFELWARDADGPVQVAGGGRYDTLLKTLGAAHDIPAVGCAIRDERVLAARGAGAR